MPNCTFFGHSSIHEDIEEPLRRVLEELIERRGVDTFYVGNHGDFDRAARKMLKEMKTIWYPHITYAVVLAYLPTKTDKLTAPDYSDTVYPEGLERVPRRAAIVKRNEWMIAQADYVITYVKRRGGAARFEEMSQKRGKTVINITKKGSLREGAVSVAD